MASTIVCIRPRPTTRAEGRGWLAVGEALTGVAFPVALLLSMPFWLMTGRRRSAPFAIVAGTTACVGVVSVLAALR